MSATATFAAQRRVVARLSWRIFAVRWSGMLLCAIAIAAVLHQIDAPRALWLALAGNVLIWPPLALWLAIRSADPDRTERASLVIDSAMAGAWIALIQFNPLPSVLLAVLSTTDELYAGIPGLWRRTLMALALTAFAVGALNGFAFYPDASSLVVWACLPAMILQPTLVGILTNRMIVRVRTQNRELDRLSSTDVLTGLGTRRFWQERARNDLVAYRRAGRPISLLMVDVDRFKTINDRHGHAIGDQILCAVADVITRHCRGSDYAARLGGDEFCVILGDTDHAQAFDVAERIRYKVSERAQLIRVPMRCTVSIGIAQASSVHDDLEHWMSQADEALYRAKSLGRDRIEPAPHPAEPVDDSVDSVNVPRQIALIR